MELLKLPLELILNITDYLSDRSINRLASTSRQLHTALLPLSYKVNAKENCCSALHFGIIENRISTTIKALENGAALDKISFAGPTAFTYTARYGSLEMLRLLLSYDEHQLNEIDGNLETALMVAVCRENVEVVRFLVAQSGVNCNYTESGVSILRCAVRSGNLEIVGLLLDSPDTDVATAGWDSFGPLGGAAFLGQLEVMKLMMQKRPHLDLHAPDKRTKYVLHQAVQGEREEVVR